MPHSVNDSTATMSRPSSTSTGSANQFPKAAGATLPTPEQVRHQLSPTRSTFSFESPAHSVQAASDRPVVVGDSHPALGATGHRPQTATSRQRALYYEDQFAYKEDTTSSARDRVTKDAPIIAELRTNVIIKDEYTLVTDLSHQLSQRYQRPESSVMITVNHSACLLLGGSFEPTYLLTINALPVQLQPTTNKRNAALLQAFMFESIGVHAERGIIKFIPIPEDSLATNGSTVLGEIERLERQQADESGINLKRALTKSSRKSTVSKAKSSIQLARSGSRAFGGRNTITPPLPSPGPFDSGVSFSGKGQESRASADSFAQKPVQKPIQHKASKKLSEKTGTKPSANNFMPPPIPEDAPTPKVSKRKSLVAIFRR